MELQATPRALGRADVNWVVAAATRAPSVHNSQPWRFRFDGNTFDVIADGSRGLEVSDPHGRELTMSCGAALTNLELALRQLGCDGAVVAFPDRSEQAVAARVTVLEGLPPTATERALFTALSRRHTHRGRFIDREISPDLAVRLQEAAWSHGCELRYVHDVGSLASVLHLARTAERISASDDLARIETQKWTPAPDSGRRDGVPARAYSQGPPAAGRDDLPGRDFDVERAFGSGERGHQPPGPVAVLTSGHDAPRDWLQAGQALQSMLLVAAADWAFAAFHSRATEVPHLRAELQRLLGTAAYPQLLLRFGYADTAPTTPRRSVDEVLDLSGPRPKPTLSRPDKLA
jgi:hypothetical protein